MKWITREHAKVDRIACPWLIKNFIDKDAEFLFVPAHKVIQLAKEQNAIPFDVPNVATGFSLISKGDYAKWQSSAMFMMLYLHIPNRTRKLHRADIE
ncbi:MAG TPA: chromate resistance protein ChrB domain-containing protein [Nitrososphaeraceae archaeon]|nr:chromate resistance protein ChrB domain-containing protein [Nitrososphaeraceae archaeon]